METSNKPKRTAPLQVSDAGLCPNFGSMVRFKRMFDRGFKAFMEKRGLPSEPENWKRMALQGRSLGAEEIRRNKIRAFIRKRQLELGEDPEEFSDPNTTQ